jgi:hypothetical protein
MLYGWLIAFAVAGMATIFVPKVLTPFDKAWMRLGEIMGTVVNPLVLGAIFFLLLTPFALVTRVFGRDELRLKKTNRITYWVDRVPPGPAAESFMNQF